MINTSPNSESCQISDVKKIVTSRNFKLDGDVIEFGTFTGGSTKVLSGLFPDKTIFTIDHFQGLEKTNKNVPKDSDWIERAFALDNPLYKHISSVPKSIEELKNRFKGHNNIEMIISDIHDLTEPSDYNISKISICNLDVDIYEPAVSSLEFLTKCEWSEIFIRFDDWHGGESEYDQHERLAFVEWIEKYKYDFQITHGGYIGGVHVKRAR
jgi:hypothetical protein